MSAFVVCNSLQRPYICGAMAGCGIPLLASSCFTSDAISSELSSLLSLPLDSIAARSRSSNSLAPEDDGGFALAPANGLGIWKDANAYACEALEQISATATAAAAASVLGMTMLVVLESRRTKRKR